MSDRSSSYLILYAQRSAELQRAASEHAAVRAVRDARRAARLHRRAVEMARRADALAERAAARRPVLAGVRHP